MNSRPQGDQRRSQIAAIRATKTAKLMTCRLLALERFPFTRLPPPSKVRSGRPVLVSPSSGRLTTLRARLLAHRPPHGSDHRTTLKIGWEFHSRHRATRRPGRLRGCPPPPQRPIHGDVGHAVDAAVAGELAAAGRTGATRMQDRRGRPRGIEVRRVGAEDEHRRATVRVRHVAESGVDADQRAATATRPPPPPPAWCGRRGPEGARRSARPSPHPIEDAIRRGAVPRPTQQHHTQAGAFPDRADERRPSLLHPVLVGPRGGRGRPPRSPPAAPPRRSAAPRRPPPRRGCAVSPSGTRPSRVRAPPPGTGTRRRSRAGRPPRATTAVISHPDPSREPSPILTGAPDRKVTSPAAEQPLRVDRDIEAALAQPADEVAPRRPRARPTARRGACGPTRRAPARSPRPGAGCGVSRRRRRPPQPSRGAPGDTCVAARRPAGTQRPTSPLADSRTTRILPTS